MSPITKKSQESCSQDSEPSLSDVEEAIRMYTYRMKRKRRLKQQSGTIKELQGILRRTESELKSVKKENEELKVKNKMIEDIQHESKEEMEKVYDHFTKSLSIFRIFRDNEKVREMQISRGNKSSPFFSSRAIAKTKIS